MNSCNRHDDIMQLYTLSYFNLDSIIALNFKLNFFMQLKPSVYCYLCVPCLLVYLGLLFCYCKDNFENLFL